MALIVEDGTGVAGANTFVNLDDCRAYALDRGVTLSDDDDTVSAMILKAMDYLKVQDWRGTAVSPLQTLPFPRENLYLLQGTYLYADNAVPDDVVAVQCQLVIEQANGVELYPAMTAAMIVEDTTGPLTTKYSDKWGPLITPTLPLVENMLSKWLCWDGGFEFRTVRA